MTTNAERMEYASDAAHEFADSALVQLFDLLSIHHRISDETAAKTYPGLLDALIQAAVNIYAIERQCESMELIAAALRDIADARKLNAADIAHASATRDTMDTCHKATTASDAQLAKGGGREAS